MHDCSPLVHLGVTSNSFYRNPFLLALRGLDEGAKVTALYTFRHIGISALSGFLLQTLNLNLTQLQVTVRSAAINELRTD